MDYPLVGGVRHEWSSVNIKLGGDLYIGVKSISYNDTLGPTKIRGTHPVPIARTRGQYDAEGSIEMYTAEARQFRKKLGPGYKEVSFDIVVSYTEDGFDTITDTIVGCRIKKDQGGGQDGTDALTVPWDLDVMNILWDGVSSIKKTLEQLAQGVPQGT